MIELRLISILDEQMPECIALRVTPEQEDFVANNVISLAEAYDVNIEREKTGKGNIAVPYAAYHNGKMVGFAMYAYVPNCADNADDEPYADDQPHYYIWRLSVDKNHQGKGIGREILRQITEVIKTKPHGEAKFCFSSYDPDNIASKTTFASCGYEEDGRITGGEAVCKIGI